MTAQLKRFTIGLAAALALGALGGGAYIAAQDQNTNQQPSPFMGRGRGPGGRGGGMGMMGVFPRLPRVLQLTDDQRTKLRSIADSHRDEWRALADRARTAHQALNEAVTAATVDEGLIRQKSAEAAAVDVDVALARARAHAEVFKILTPEQKSQLDTLKANMKAHRGGGRGQ